MESPVGLGPEGTILEEGRTAFRNLAAARQGLGSRVDLLEVQTACFVVGVVEGIRMVRKEGLAAVDRAIAD